MKTSVMEVNDMLSVLSVDGVEKQISEVAGVESVTVNFAAGNATVRYDETRRDIADIRSSVRQSSYETVEHKPAGAGGEHENRNEPGKSPKTRTLADSNVASDSADANSAPPANSAASSKANASTGAPVVETSPVAKPGAKKPATAPGGEAHQHNADGDKN